MFTENARVTNAAEKGRFGLVPDRRNLNQFLEEAHPAPRGNGGIEAGQRSCGLLFAHQCCIEPRLQRRRSALVRIFRLGKNPAEFAVLVSVQHYATSS